jgi:hypothetical protein
MVGVREMGRGGERQTQRVERRMHREREREGGRETYAHLI